MPDTVSAADAAAFRATNRTFEEDVMARGDFAALARVYTNAARLLSPGVPSIGGLDGLADYWKGAVNALGVTGARLHTLEMSVCGDRAAEIGRAEIFTREGGPMPVEAKYILLWKREADGWRWDADCWNTSV